MKAIVQGKYGPPSALRVADITPPRVGDRDVLVKVHTSAVTHADRRLRSGDFPGIAWLPGRLAMGMTGPRKPVRGTVFAGRVVEVGRAVTRFSVGDDVFGGVLHGAWAEFMTVREDGPLAQMPASFDYEGACTLPYAATTALVFLRDLGRLQRGQHVCVVGASGGVGRMAVQLARHMGAEVTGVCSGTHHELVRSLGADHLVDYHSQDFRDTKRPFDVIFDTAGGSGFDHCRRSLTPEGRYLSLVVSAGLFRHVLWSRIVGGQRALTGVASDNGAIFEALRKLAEEGAFRPVIDRTYPLEQIAEAHVRLEEGARGTVVVKVGASRA